MPIFWAAAHVGWGAKPISAILSLYQSTNLINCTMAKTTWWDVIERTLEKAGVPLSAGDIWKQAHALKTIGDFKTPGKTPWATIGAYCYMDIAENGLQSRVVQTSKRPSEFALRRLEKTTRAAGYTEAPVEPIEHFEPVEINEKEKGKGKRRFHERDLHPILVAYAKTSTHFHAYLKTIFHESSTKGKKGQNEWLHPDIVGVYFPFDHYREELLKLQSHLSVSSIRLFSFEMKVSIGFGNLRECYFQAVSNSSWANEGYLVTLELDDDEELMDEIRRLNNAFGIGLIKLDPLNVYESRIVLPSRVNPEIDWDTVNRLSTENRDFKDFLKLIEEDCRLGKVKSQYDHILKAEDLEKLLREKSVIA
jgi:uncharacterized protein